MEKLPGPTKGFHWVGLPLQIEHLGTIPGFVVRLLRPVSLTIWIDEFRYRVEVPLGWVTDLTSSPEQLPLRKEGRWTPASVVHDFLYATGRVTKMFHPDDSVLRFRFDHDGLRVTRRLADQIFREAMLSLGTSVSATRVRHWGARFGGWVRWRKARRIQLENQDRKVERGEVVRVRLR